MHPNIDDSFCSMVNHGDGTVLTSILTSEVTEPQSELGNVLGTQSGTWGNLVQHMCKSQQTTSVKIYF